MSGKIVLTFWDYDSEPSTASCPSGEVTDLTYADINAKMSAYFAAVEAITIGNLVKDTRIMEVDQQSKLPAGDKTAQREMKWLVRMHNAAGDPLKMLLPCADLSFLDENNRAQMDKDAAEYTALTTAIAALFLTDGQTVYIDDVIFVGRNL